MTHRTPVLIGILLALMSACEPEAPTSPSPPSFGELQLFVTSFAGSGVDPEKLTVGIDAVSIGTTESGYASAVGIASPVTLRLPTGSWEVRTRASTGEFTALGVPPFCDPSTDVEIVTILEGRATRLERQVTCTLPGGLLLRTSVTGIDPELMLKFQFADAPGVCDLVDFPDTYSLEWASDDAFKMYPVAHVVRAPMRPGSYTLNLCGLPAHCPTDHQSRTFVVREDQLTEVAFAARCEG